MNRALDILRAAPREPVRPWPRHVLTPERWRGLAATLAVDDSVDLVALWADPGRVHAIFLEASGHVLPVAVPVAGTYAALSPVRPAAAWCERMIREIWGHVAEGGRELPIRPNGPAPDPAEACDPGRLRFEADGDTIVRLEVPRSFAHRARLAAMRGQSVAAAARDAGRLSSDAPVAHGIAYASAVEAAAGCEAPPHAHALRGVMAELERLSNHLGDLGGIAAEAALTFLPARCGYHREAILQAAALAFGDRLMIDRVVPGGVAGDIAPGGTEAIQRAVAALEVELPGLILVYEHSSKLGHRMSVGVVAPRLAARFGAGGFVGRASGRGVDARRKPGYPPYLAFAPSVPVRREGDADARVRVRFDELRESSRIVRTLLAQLPRGATRAALPAVSGEGIGVAESFRGDLWLWVRLDGGSVADMFVRDPSWLHWPLLAAAIGGTTVAEFPLIEKSFNCSLSAAAL